MATTTFIDFTTPIVASWLNDVNYLTYTGMAGALTTPAFTPTGTVGGQLVGTINNSYQLVIQNTSPGFVSSSGVLLASNNTTSTTHYGKLQINSSGYSLGTSAFNFANAVAFYSVTGDLAIGTKSANSLHLVTNDSATDSITLDSAGNVNFPTPNMRLTGDFSNTTYSARATFQSNVLNGVSQVGVIPNGSGTNAAFISFNSSNPDNSSITTLITTASQSSVRASLTGAGTFLPLTLFTSDTEFFRGDTKGLIGIKGAPNANWSATYQVVQLAGGPTLWSANNTNINLSSNLYNDGTTRYLTTAGAGSFNASVNGTTLFGYQSGTAGNAAIVGTQFNVTATDCSMITPNGGLGYGTGAGGTVTQATSKSTTVVLSKPCGQITMNNASLAANTAVTFTWTNTLVTATDTFTWSQQGGTQGAYNLTFQCSAGSVSVTLRNLTAGALGEAFAFQFALIRVVNS